SRSPASGRKITGGPSTVWTTWATTPPVSSLRRPESAEQLLGVEAIREFNVLGHSYGAEYGKRSGGQVTAVTTSGTNQVHGTVFEYLRFNASYLYQLPFGNGQRFASGATGLVNQLVGGWQWNGIFTAQSGFPFTPLAGSNPSGTGDSSQSDVPNWNPNFKGPVILGKPDQWFDPRAFLLPTAGTFGNVSRGSLRGPQLVNFDTSLFKKLTIKEALTLQFRV